MPKLEATDLFSDLIHNHFILSLTMHKHQKRQPRNLLPRKIAKADFLNHQDSVKTHVDAATSAAVLECPDEKTGLQLSLVHRTQLKQLVCSSKELD
jgi:hypothetical protein